MRHITFSRNATNENLPPLHHPQSISLRGDRISPLKSEIRNPDGSMVFSLDEVEVPLNWSQVATDGSGASSLTPRRTIRREGCHQLL